MLQSKPESNARNDKSEQFYTGIDILQHNTKVLYSAFYFLVISCITINISLIM